MFFNPAKGIGTVSVEFEELKEQVKALEALVATTKEGLSKDVAQLSASMESVNTEVGTLKTKDNQLNNAINTNKNEIAQLKEKDVELEVAIGINEESINGLVTKDTQLTNSINSANQEITTAKGNITSLQNSLAATNEKVDEIWDTLNPIINVTSVSVAQPAVTIEIGQNHTIKATVLPSDATDKSVTYVSSNNNVASVNANGVISAKASGAATITVKTVDGNKQAQVSVTVPVPVVNVTSVSVATASTTLEIGETHAIQATVLPANATNKSVTYTSSNGNIAGVNNSGVITAKAEGAAVITVKTVDGNKQATVNVTVNPEPTPEPEPETEAPETTE